MAYKLIWSPAARDDLHDIVVFIARDNPNRAMSFGHELISGTDRLQEFPEVGRIVPEYRNDYIREIVIRPYRIVYRVDHENRICEIARVWHSARGIRAILTTTKHSFQKREDMFGNRVSAIASIIATYRR